MAQPKESKAKKKSATGLNGTVKQSRKHPGISKTPGVCGGAACIKGLRMPVWLLYRFKLKGVSELKDAWRYVEDHPREIAKRIKDNSW
jgi:Protein of unknown function (DUF433)